MGNASDFVIENGVLKKYIGAGKNVVISDDVKVGILPFITTDADPV